MTHVRAIHVNIKTAVVPEASMTQDRLYLGLAGNDGGREFPLSVADQELFTAGKGVRLLLGREEDLVSPQPFDFHPDKSENPNQRNSPRFYRVEQADVTHVYLRKEGDLTHAGDDAWKLEDVEVQLHDPFAAGSVRRFVNQDPVDVPPEDGEDEIWLGNEYGHQVWLRELPH